MTTKTIDQSSIWKNIPLWTICDNRCTSNPNRTRMRSFSSSYSLLVAPVFLASSLSPQTRLLHFQPTLILLFYFRCHHPGPDFHYTTPLLFQVFLSSNHPWLYPSAARFGKYIIYYLYARYGARHFQNLIYSSYNHLRISFFPHTTM